MDIFAPHYYNDFLCLKDKCHHNCCIGWEIDIDEETLEFYKTKDDIIKNISVDDTAHFILKDDRCPFLNQCGLCNIIINYGEENLCQICRDHPRFINEFDTRTEIGLGLACEGAAKLILDNDLEIKKIGEDNFILTPNLQEDSFFDKRQKLLNTDPQEIKSLLPRISVSSLADFFRTLERLDSKWEFYLDSLKNRHENINDIKINDICKAKRLFSYFIFRHFHTYGLEFCLLCTYFILSISGDIYDIARAFSAEIEYSDENAERIINFFTYYRRSL